MHQWDIVILLAVAVDPLSNCCQELQLVPAIEPCFVVWKVRFEFILAHNIIGNFF